LQEYNNGTTVIVLNEDQERAIKELKRFIYEDKYSKEYVVSGPAGTGKSTIIRQAIKDYPGKIFLTATTNQAVDVLKTIWEKQSGGVENIYIGTIHKLLGLYLDIEYNEEKGTVIEILKINKDYKSPIGNGSLIIIDEASMLSKNMYKIVQEAIMLYNCKIIYMGDFQQLPPVKENISLVFDIPNRISLKKVMRQKEGSDLLKFIENIRRSPSFQEDKSLRDVVFIKDQKEFVDKAYELFSSQGYKTNPNLVKIVAWSNKSVSKYNNILKERIRYYYGLRKVDFVTGDRLICTKQYSKQRTIKGVTHREIILNSSQEVTLESIAVTKKLGITSYEMQVRDNRGKLIKIYTVKPSNYKTFLNKLNRYKKQYRKTKDIREKMKLISFSNAFASMDHAYAITSHRTQGSTYDNVFVDYLDIKSILDIHHDEGVNPEEYFHRCLYTAVSRASEKLYILI
jgi:ATP-dependent exoDNAse (exonuclease V) alpha subunit